MALVPVKAIHFPVPGMPVSVEGTYKNVTYLVNNVVVVVVLCSAYYSLCSFVHQTVAKANTTIETKRQVNKVRSARELDQLKT